MRFGDVLEAVEELSLDEQTELIEIVRNRLLESRRTVLAGEVREAQVEYEAGLVKSLLRSETLPASRFRG
jgi:hypothetical protein